MHYPGIHLSLNFISAPTQALECKYRHKNMLIIFLLIPVICLHNDWGRRVQLHRKGKVDKYLGSPHRLLRNISQLFLMPLLARVSSDCNQIESRLNIRDATKIGIRSS